MRPVVVITAVVAASGALGTFAFVRLAGTLEQLRTIDVAAAPARAIATPPSRAITPPPSSNPPAAEVAVAVAPADDGDRQIQTWLAADAEFQRAAAELLNDPDPHVQAEARAAARAWRRRSLILLVVRAACAR